MVTLYVTRQIYRIGSLLRDHQHLVIQAMAGPNGCTMTAPPASSLESRASKASDTSSTPPIGLAFQLAPMLGEKHMEK